MRSPQPTVLHDTRPSRALTGAALGLAAVLLASDSASAAAKNWSGSGADDNWSTAGNWAPPGVPVTGDDLTFDDVDATGTAGAGGTPNSLVDSLFATSLRSLRYTNLAGFHTTAIQPPGLSLSGGTATTVVYVGTGGDHGADQQVYATMQGSRMSITNLAGTILLRQTASALGSHRATWDLSGLDQLGAAVATIAIGRSTESSTQTQFNRPQATLLLAKTNSIRATNELVVGQCVSNPGQNNTELFLGQENLLYLGALRVGFRKHSALMQFQADLTNPRVLIRDASGFGRLPHWSISDNGSGTTGTSQTSRADFTGGEVDALVENLYIGRGYSGDGGTDAGRSDGTLTLDRGLLDVTTLEVGYHAGNNNGRARGWLNVGTNAQVRVGKNLRLGNRLGTNQCEGTLNLDGGTVRVAGDLLDGGGTTSLNLTNGLVDLKPDGDATPGTVMVDTLNWDSGVMTNFGALYATDLNLGPSLTGFTVPAGTTLGATAPGVVGTLTLPAGDLTLRHAKLHCDMYDSATLSDQINVAFGALRLEGTNDVMLNLMTGALPNGTYPLIAAGMGVPATGSQNFRLAGPASTSRHTFGFETANGFFVNLVVGGSEALHLTWSGDGSANIWDLQGVANWNGRTEKFYSFDAVTFDDTGSTSPHVNLVGTLIPVSVTMSNRASDYTFAGTGSLSGAAALTLAGTGRLTILTSNDNSGPLTLNSGTLQLGDGTALDGALGPGPIANAGTLVFNPAGTQGVAGVITGSGTVRKQGPGVTALSGANGYDGPTLVTAGTLQTLSTTALGTTNGATIVTNGGTLDFADRNLGLEPVIVSGDGVGGQGALIDSNPSTAVLTALRDVTMAGDTVVGGSGRWDLRAGAVTDPGLRGNGYKLTKVGSNFVAIVAPTAGFWETGLGDVDIRTGSLSFEQPVSLGLPNRTLTIRSNANLQIYDTKLSNTLSKVIVVEDGGWVTPSGPAAGTGTNVFAGSISLTGTGRVNTAASCRFLVQGPITGAGALVKLGNGFMRLGSTCTYSGNTVISASSLALTPGASIASSSNIIVTAGGVFDVSELPGFALASGQTLAGNGAVTGSVTVATGSTLAPGHPVGTLTLANDLTLAGTTIMELDKTAAPNNDQAAVTGALRYGGTLMVTNAGSLPLVVGDRFTLFSKPGSGQFTSIVYPSGYTFTNRLALDGSIEVTGVTVSSTPTNLTWQVSGDLLTLAWPESHRGWRLEFQTNSIAVGLSTNWFTWPGSAAVTQTNLPIAPASAATFYRLVYP